MGAPQLAENAPPKKRGELYGNRVPGLGRPSGTPAGSRPGSPSPLPSGDESPSPRKRCTSTGAGFSTPPSSFPTDEPVPALPNGLAGAPRRNSVAVNFASGRRVMSASDAEGKTGELVDVSPPSLPASAPDKPPDAEPPTPEPVVESVEQPQPSSIKTPEVTPSQPSGEQPAVDEPLPIDSSQFKVDSPAEDPPAPKNRTSLYDASQNVSQSASTEQSSKDSLSEYESAPQSAVSQPSLSNPEPAKSVPPSMPTNTPSVAPRRAPARAKTVVVSVSPQPAEKATKQVPASRESSAAIPAPSPTAPAPPSTATPNPPTKAEPQRKSTFKAVVHRKVTEQPVPPAPVNLAPPEIQPIRQRRGVSAVNVVEVPPSPGVGDLAVLLEDAAMLEWRLEEGGTGLKLKEPLDKTPTSATFQPGLRQTSASTLTEHTHVPSVDGGSQSGRSVSIPSIREPLTDGEIPEEEETDGRSLASTTFSQRSPSHRKYLANIYRLTSRRSSSYMPGSYPRDSMSMSSEDSSPVTTPSDTGKHKGFGIAWPTASPKKGGPNVSRSSSFADKIFNRNRTRSNVSSADQGTSHSVSLCPC